MGDLLSQASKETTWFELFPSFGTKSGIGKNLLGMARRAGEARTEDTEVTEVHGNTLRDPVKARRFTDVGEAFRFPKSKPEALHPKASTFRPGDARRLTYLLTYFWRCQSSPGQAAHSPKFRTAGLSSEGKHP
jgi:hypothetical protein